MDHGTYFAWKTTVYYAKLIDRLIYFHCEESGNDQTLCSYSGLLHKMEELAKAQFRSINVEETVFYKKGLTVANINLPQGE